MILVLPLDRRNATAIHLSALPLPAVVKTNIIAIAIAMAPPALGLPLSGLLWQ
jgi:hypothetical protein